MVVNDISKKYVYSGYWVFITIVCSFQGPQSWHISTLGSKVQGCGRPCLSHTSLTPPSPIPQEWLLHDLRGGGWYDPSQIISNPSAKTKSGSYVDLCFAELHNFSTILQKSSTEKCCQRQCQGTIFAIDADNARRNWDCILSWNFCIVLSEDATWYWCGAPQRMTMFGWIIWKKWWQHVWEHPFWNFSEMRNNPYNLL